MKYRAPEGVTALFCAGETIAPDEAGLFEAGEDLASELASHGCAAFVAQEPDDEAAPKHPPRGRPRSEKAN
ncbi:hypothetical protein [Rhodoblastus sp.]|uniref:hypothetical protein n=1 Tax=Rhodoblastus sp. TaxID=1962975 RepID=UPI003F977420